MTSILARVCRHLYRSFVDASLDALPKMLVIGVIGTAGFPAYYYVWAVLYPQPYEDLGLRLACSAIAAPLMLAKHWPRWAQSMLPLYWYVALVFCLPFFMGYMLLHNGVDSIWPMSWVASLLILFLIADSANAAIMSAIGTIAAVLVVALVEGGFIPWADYEVFIPVYVFALVTGIFLNLSNEREERARTLAARALGGYVAHELRNPLSTIELAARVTKECAPALVEAYRRARRCGLDVPPIADSHLDFLARVGEITGAEVGYSLMVIDMMLKKAGANTGDVGATERLSILASVQRALDRYAFKSADERDCVKVDTRSDFAIDANETLLHHVIFNLLKNALYSIKAAQRRGSGTIHVWAVRGVRTNRLHIRDNGIGMSPQTVARIFEPFFTTHSRGTGLGLHFCRDVMRRLGGEISCESCEGCFTELVLSFPLVPEAQVSAEGSRSRARALLGKGAPDNSPCGGEACGPPFGLSPARRTAR